MRARELGVTSPGVSSRKDGRKERDASMDLRERRQGGSVEGPRAWQAGGGPGVGEADVRCCGGPRVVQERWG